MAIKILFFSLTCHNLESCVNVVLDFVSPENVTECIQLIDELRLLPENHKAQAEKFEVNFVKTLLQLTVFIFCINATVILVCS